MSNISRKRRGMKTQALVAEWWQRHGYPYATDAGAGRPGRDILNTPGLAIEVKARAGFDPVAWLRQADTSSGGDVPLAIFRPNGFGPARIDEWPALIRIGDLHRLADTLVAGV